MSEQNRSVPDMNKALFVNLIMMFTSSAMQQLGKILDPMTQKAEVNLQGAQVSIDMLTMLREKTDGNLDTEEKRMLDESISSLQMNYIETAKEHKSAKVDAPEASAAAEEHAEETEAQPPKPEPKEESGREPKYHKSYGS